MSLSKDQNICDHKVSGRKPGEPCPYCGKVLPPEKPVPEEWMYDADKKQENA